MVFYHISLRQRLLSQKTTHTKSSITMFDTGTKTSPLLTKFKFKPKIKKKKKSPSPKTLTPLSARTLKRPTKASQQLTPPPSHTYVSHTCPRCVRPLRPVGRGGSTLSKSLLSVVTTSSWGDPSGMAVTTACPTLLFGPEDHHCTNNRRFYCKGNAPKD